MSVKCIAVIPAAGVGKRMGLPQPKQYQLINGKTILEHTVAALSRVNAISEIIIAISENDETFSTLPLANQRGITTVIGGQARCDSVLNALNHLVDSGEDDTWVLVHDAARPFIDPADVEELIEEVIEIGVVGGLLVTPVSDTLKMVQGGDILETVPRDNLYQAQTPQMFKAGLLKKAIGTALDNHVKVTDESSAVESMGYKPLAVEAESVNFKLTTPQDMKLAQWLLSK